MALKRVENVLDYLINLNQKQPIEKMTCAETHELLKALGWKEERNFERARHKLLGLMSIFD